jgi:hypothetical protein
MTTSVPLVAQLLGRLEALERRLAALEAREGFSGHGPGNSSRPSRDDSELLEAIGTVADGECFVASDIIALSRVDTGLRRLLVAQGCDRAPALGLRLRALVDVPAGRWRVHRIGRDAGGTLWAIDAGDLHDLHGGHRPG